MTAALAGRVEDALAGLEKAERTALDRVARGGDDYLTVAAELGTSREGVADLLVSARLAIWSRLHDGEPPARRTPQCAPARRVLAALSDREAVSGADTERAREHLADCDACVAARLALREAELASRAWRATAPPSAADRVTSVPEDDEELPRVVRPRRAPVVRRRVAAAVVAVVLLIVALAVVLGGGDDGVPRPAAPATGPGSAQGSGKDVVPPPGDRFCPAEQPDCK